MVKSIFITYFCTYAPAMMNQSVRTSLKYRYRYAYVQRIVQDYTNCIKNSNENKI